MYFVSRTRSHISRALTINVLLSVLPFVVGGARAELSNGAITIAVEKALWRDQGVASQLIDAETENGIVSLTGSVENLLAKERSTAIVRTIKGVRSVVNTLGIKTIPRTDARLREDVMAALAMDPVTQLFDITATVTSGEVRLTGKVQSWLEKEAASQVASKVRGVQDLHNEVVIDNTVVRSDDQIRAEIERGLRWDVWLAGEPIAVTVDGGAVELMGRVATAAQKSRAYGYGHVPGVKSVNAVRLSVDWREMPVRKWAPPTRHDYEIARAVSAALSKDPRTATSHLGVEVKGGVVTLSGEVRNLKSRLVAEEDALNTIGVVRVRNHLRVRPQRLMPDDQIAKRVRAAFDLDPVIYGGGIRSTVRNGKVYLRGTVDSDFQRQHAEKVVSGINQVIAIANHLVVDAPAPQESIDGELAEDIENAVRWNPLLDGEVEVAAENGVVTLTGVVDNPLERAIAERYAFDAGAKAVVNRLETEQRILIRP